ncbi:protein FAM32A isoform X1 [Macaca fascicularis]|uniref:protein FAM32A isoform X1 n=1 Tax=Macaca fascicularis TaxID=9541 RepID=UPI003D15D3F9
MEAYEQVQKGPLKLKGVAELGVTKRKKKKKDKDKAKLLEAMGTSKKNEEEKRRGLDKRTPAQAAFEKMQEKRVSKSRRRRGGQGHPAPGDSKLGSGLGRSESRGAVRGDLNYGEMMLCVSERRVALCRGSAKDEKTPLTLVGSRGES